LQEKCSVTKTSHWKLVVNANIAEYQTGLAEHYGHSIHVKSPEKLDLNLAFEEKAPE